MGPVNNDNDSLYDSLDDSCDSLPEMTRQVGGARKDFAAELASVSVLGLGVPCK